MIANFAPTWIYRSQTLLQSEIEKKYTMSIVVQQWDSVMTKSAIKVNYIVIKEHHMDQTQGRVYMVCEGRDGGGNEQD